MEPTRLDEILDRLTAINREQGALLMELDGIRQAQSLLQHALAGMMTLVPTPGMAGVQGKMTRKHREYDL